MQIDESEEQSLNASTPIQQRSENGANVTLERPEHLKKQPWQSDSTDDGRQMARSDVLQQKAKSSIRERREPDSNVTVERL
jgi:hypothetical protein